MKSIFNYFVILGLWGVYVNITGVIDQSISDMTFDYWLAVIGGIALCARIYSKYLI